MEDRVNPPSVTGQFFRNLAVLMFAPSVILAWLPMIRCLMEGADYQWELPLFFWRTDGAGLSGDFWTLPVQAGLGTLLLYLGLRHPSRFSYWFLAIVLALYAVSWLLAYFMSPGDLVFRGDSLGVEFNIGLAGAFYSAVAAMFAILGARFEFALDRPRPVHPWTRANTIILLMALAIVPAQFILFNRGPQHGANDALGVYATLAQWGLILLALLANRPHRRL
jgi:hypothetical protein